MAPQIAVVDVGTTSVRVSLMNQYGDTTAVYQKHNPPFFRTGGFAEQDPSSWSKVVTELLTTAVQSNLDSEQTIAAITVTAQRSSVIPIGRDGEALRNAIMWQDTRAHQVCRKLSSDETTERDVYRRTGTRILPVFSAPKIRWIAENEPEIAAQATRYVGVQATVLHTLTGRYVTDRSFAGRSLLYNLSHKDWDDHLLALFGVNRSTLSDLVDPGQIVGEITSSVAAVTGLSEGVPVITAGGDQQCAALGMGLTNTDRLVINTGTGSYVLGLTTVPHTDDSMSFFCNPAATPGQFIVEASVPTTGSAYRWLNRTLFSPNDPDNFAEINAAAQRAPSGANGLRFIPHLQGSGAPDWDSAATGTLTGLTLGTTSDDFARAAIEGIVAEIASAVEIVSHQTGRPTAVTSSGGLTAFPLFSSILQSKIGVPIEVPATTESTSRGAWAVATTSIGWYRSVDDALIALNTKMHYGK